MGKHGDAPVDHAAKSLRYVRVDFGSMVHMDDHDRREPRPQQQANQFGSHPAGKDDGHSRVDPQPAEVRIDLPVAAHLPDEYVASQAARLEAYRRLAAAATQAEVDDVVAEWEDRFGPLPRRAGALIEMARQLVYWRRKPQQAAAEVRKLPKLEKRF